MSVSFLGETNTFIKGLNDRIINRLQTRPTESQRKIKLKPAVEVSNYLRAGLILLFNKAKGLTFHQVLAIMLE